MLGTKPKALSKITIKNGKQAGACFQLLEGDKKIIGRDNSCHLQVLDKGISRNHSLLEHKGDHFLLVDLGSTNGTFVNNKIIISKRLGDGDVIKIGQTELLYEEIRPKKGSTASFVDDVLLDNTIMERVDVGHSLCGVSLDDFRGRDQKQQGKDDTAATYLSTIYEVSNLINAEQDQQKLLDAVTDKIMEVFKPDRAAVVMEDQDAFEVLVAKSARGNGDELKLSSTILKKTIKEGVSVLSGNASLDFASNGGRSIITNQLKSVMSVPLESHKEILGAIYVELGSVNRFTKAHLDLLTAIGKQAGVAIERARLFEHFMEKEKLKQEMKIAQEIQKDLLPTNVPETFAYDLVGWNRSCDDTGGDYYDYFELPNGRFAFAVGDVTGHGIGAAFVMATARAFLKALAYQGKSIPKMLFELNNLVESDTEDDKFMTLFYGELDVQKLKLYYANAGHDSPLLYRKSRNEFEELDSTGIPLGMLPDSEYDEGSVVQIEMGDILIMSTDGITESMNPEGDQFGQERFMDLIRKSANKSGNQIVRECYDALQKFCRGTAQRDDLTMVVLKFERRIMATQKLVTIG